MFGVRRLIRAASALAVVAGLSFGGLGAKADDKVVIGGNLPLTGPIAAYSGNYFKGFQMGLDEGCKQAEIACDQFVLDAQDNAGDMAQAVSVVQKQLLAKPSAIVSGVSQQSLAIAPEIDKAGIPHFLIAFDPFITTKGDNRLRVLPNYKVEAPLYLKFIKEKGAKRVFNIILNISSAVDQFSLIVEPALKEAGIEFEHEIYDFGTTDYNNIVLKARQFKPDVVVVNGFSFHHYPILKALRTYGLIDGGGVIFGMDFVDLLYNGTPRDELKGVSFVTPIFEIPGAVATAADWRKRYEAAFGKAPSYVEAYAYDNARIIVAAKKAGGNVSVDSIRKVLPFSGVTGEINLDQDRDIIATVANAKVNDKGEVEALP